MNKHHFSDHAAGAKTIWIIDFPKTKETYGTRPLVPFYISSKAPLRESYPIDHLLFEKTKENYTEFLDKLTKLSALLEKECKDTIKDIESAQNEVKSIDSSIDSLGYLIKKFNEMIKKLRKKPEGS